MTSDTDFKAVKVLADDKICSSTIVQKVMTFLFQICLVNWSHSDRIQLWNNQAMPQPSSHLQGLKLEFSF